MLCSVCAEATSLAIGLVPGYIGSHVGHRLGFMIHTTRRQVPSLPLTDETAHGGVAQLYFINYGVLMLPMFTKLDHRNYRFGFTFVVRQKRGV